MKIQDRFTAFVADRHPFALEVATRAFTAAVATTSDPEALRTVLGAKLEKELDEASAILTAAPAEILPGVGSGQRWDHARRELLADCDGFLRREAITASLNAEEKVEMLRGMLLTRAVDNRLKAFFTGGEVRYGKKAFQGKGFRSLGQEAIYAAPLRLLRGGGYQDTADGWRGDVVAPLIRDLGAALAMHGDDEAIRRVFSAQMGKAGPPMGGKDLHIGDWEWGVLPPTAPLSISAMTMTGIAFAMGKEAQESRRRVAVTFIGEGGTSLGEWHEALNVCAVHRLPAVFCIENNQTALSTPVHEQTAARCFADKASGYGVPGLSIDGTDPEAIAAAFAWAAERARKGLGPTLIELVCMRMCGHAHHDDMLYLGREPSLGWDYPTLPEGGVGYIDRELYDFWARRDPIALYAAKLEDQGLVTAESLAGFKEEIEARVEAQAHRVITSPWPAPEEAGEGVYTESPAAHRVDVLDERAVLFTEPFPGLPELEPGAPFDPRGTTFLEAVMLGVQDVLRSDERAFVYGEDVGGQYGNSFLLLRPLLDEFAGRLVNSPLTESGTLAVAIGAALSGLRPIAEIQFNDFIATGFNQLVNNAAKIHYRWGASVPMVVRMPWGGLRGAGPYHSQNTESWFYRTPGLKIVAPSTPEDARALLAAAVADPDPVLFYEHIALYRQPAIKQCLPATPPAPLALGKAALRRSGSDLAIVSYGAYVHRCLQVAERLAEGGIEAAVLDLRSLAPLDRTSLLAVARHCGKVLVVHEDTRTGGLGESLAAIVQEEAFEYLDAPVRILGALDTPVPYSPPLEAAFLPSQSAIERAARFLASY